MNKKAYIDPGFGSTLISTILNLLAIIFITVGAFLIKYFWKPIKKLVRREK